MREFGIHAGHVNFFILLVITNILMLSSSSEQECLSCMGQLSIRIKFNFANSIFSGLSTECGQVGIFGCLLTPWPGGSTRVCSCCLPGGRHGYRRSSLAGGSHSSWREFDVHGENVLSGLGRAAYLKSCWGEVFCGKADVEQLRGPSPINMNASLPSVLLGLL